MSRRQKVQLAIAVLVVVALLVARGIAWPPGREVASAPAPAAHGGAQAPGPTSALVTGAATASVGVTNTTSAGQAPNAAQASGAKPPAPNARATRRRVSAIDASQLDPRVTQATISKTIGVRGWTKRVRPPESFTEPIKLRLMREHGYTDSPADYELDHFIPLEVGGSSNLSNLWLEPIGEARRKDKDENLAHREVVSAAWTLAQGQQYIRDHWKIHYSR